MKQPDQSHTFPPSMVDQLLLQLAAISTAASGWSGCDPAVKGDFAWSPAYQEVLELRAKYEDVSAKYKALLVEGMA